MKKNKIIIIILSLAILSLGIYFYKYYNFYFFQKAHNTKYEWWYFNGFFTDENGDEYLILHSINRYGNHYTILYDRKNKKIYTKNLINNDFNQKKLSSEKYKWDNLSVSEYSVAGYDENFEINFNLKSDNNILYWNNKEKLMGKKNGYVYYYTIPHVSIDGTIKIDDLKLKLKGHGLIDHNWGDWTHEDIDKWEWGSVYLDDGSMLLFILIYKDQVIITKDAYYIFKDGKFLNLKKFILNKNDSGLWNFTADFEDKKIELNFDMDYPIFDGPGEVTGKVLGEKISGKIIGETRHYYEDSK